MSSHSDSQKHKRGPKPKRERLDVHVAPRESVVAHVSKHISVRHSKVYGPRGMRERCTAEEWWLAIQRAIARGGAAKLAAGSFTLEEISALYLATLAAMDNVPAELHKLTLVRLRSAQTKLAGLLGQLTRHG